METKAMELQPSRICFSVEIIDNVFHRNSHHCYSQIGETLDALCEEKIQIHDIPPISVIKHNYVWLTANNRRLWVFRQMERVAKCIKIPVVVVKELPNSTNTVAASVVVREDPGGIWHLLPSCKMQDPLNKIIWDTAKYIKEFMFPPPNQRMIIQIFQNLSNTDNKPSRRHGFEESSKEDCSLSELRVDLVQDEINLFRRDYMDRDRRTQQWILDHNIYSTLTIQNMEIGNKIVCNQKPGIMNVDMGNGKHLALDQHLTLNRMPFDALDSTDQHSEPSILTSGYLFLTGDTGNTCDDDKLSLLDDHDMQLVCNELSDDNKVLNAFKPQGDSLVNDLNSVICKITNEITRIFLNGQPADMDKVSEIKTYMQELLTTKFADYDMKIDTDKREIASLKETTEKLKARDEEIKAPRKKVEENERTMEAEADYRTDKAFSIENPSQSCSNYLTVETQTDETKTEKSQCMCSCHHSDTFLPYKTDGDTKASEHKVSLLEESDDKVESSDILQNLQEQNRKLRKTNSRLEQEIQKMKFMQNENLRTLAESLLKI